MFGNQTGWLISAVIVLIGSYLGYQLVQLMQPTPPTGWAVQAAKLSPQVADSARGIMEPMTNTKDDAGTLVRKAIADYESHKAQYQELQTSKDLNMTTVEQMSGLNDLITAAGCPTMDLFKSKPDDLVGFVYPIPEIEDLNDICRTMGMIIVSAKADGKFDVASKYANALAALGYHLYQERIAYTELSAGETYLDTGCAGMIEIAKAQNADAKIDTLKQFDDARKTEFNDHIDPVIKIISGQSQQDIGDHAGDMFQIAADPAADLVWRVEAIRKVGRLQFNAEKQADQTKAPRFLSKLATDSDPIIQAAAVKSRDMTARDNQAQR